MKNKLREKWKEVNQKWLIFIVIII
jgi:hypothetical protein